MRSLKYIVPAVLLAAVIGWQQLKAMIVAEGPLQEVVNVVIPKGAGTKLVAQELKKAGIIRHELLFRIATRLNGADKALKAGEYQFMPKVSVLQAMEKIARGEVFLSPDYHSRRTDQRPDYVYGCQLSGIKRRNYR